MFSRVGVPKQPLLNRPLDVPVATLGGAPGQSLGRTTLRPALEAYRRPDLNRARFGPRGRPGSRRSSVAAGSKARLNPPVQPRSPTSAGQTTQSPFEEPLSGLGPRRPTSRWSSCFHCRSSPNRLDLRSYAHASLTTLQRSAIWELASRSCAPKLTGDFRAGLDGSAGRTKGRNTPSRGP